MNEIYRYESYDEEELDIEESCRDISKEDKRANHMSIMVMTLIVLVIVMVLIRL